jgi:hypothetical protein
MLAVYCVATGCMRFLLKWLATGGVPPSDRSPAVQALALDGQCQCGRGGHGYM